ncbi:MAG: Glu/Leu/Phe/Val dehydrogenase dimerization domain-containing protein [Bacilli bacterium]|jgi:leucine dehydrogenase
MSDFKVFEYMAKHNYEQVVYFYDKTTGLRGITAIHNTKLGPALGGTRIWNYESEEAAVMDALRLARGMTYKSAAAGLNLGGGKTVLIGDASKVKSEAYFRALGRYVQSLNGRYITAEDVNTSTQDMSFVNMETDYVVGLEGKSGNPSPITALGAFYGIKAALKYKFGDDDVAKYSFAVQGAGQTGYFLINYLIEAGAKKIYLAEINPKHIDRMKKEHPEVVIVPPEDIYGIDVDVFSPCALGGVLDNNSIPKIKARIVAGTANNVLLDEDIHGPMLTAAGILYAPDFVINAGGVINVYHEIHGYNRENVMAEVKLIYNRLLEIFAIADEQKVHTQLAAKLYAQKRIATIQEVRANYIKR